MRRWNALEIQFDYSVPRGNVPTSHYDRDRNPMRRISDILFACYDRSRILWSGSVVVNKAKQVDIRWTHCFCDFVLSCGIRSHHQRLTLYKSVVPVSSLQKNFTFPSSFGPTTCAHPPRTSIAPQAHIRTRKRTRSVAYVSKLFPLNVLPKWPLYTGVYQMVWQN